MVEKKKARGWYAAGQKPPRTGKGSATVGPIRFRSHIEAIKEHLSGNQRDLALFVCGINFALRGGDLLGLRWKDVLTPNGRVRGRIEVIEQKTGNLRGFLVCPNARKELEKLWQDLSKSGPEPEPDDYLFPSRKGRDRMSIQRLHQLVNEWCAAIKLEGHFGSHSLRKTYGYHTYKGGCSLGLLMEEFGHSSEQITLRYIGITDDDKDRVHFKVNL